MLDLAAERAAIGPAIDEAVLRTLASGRFVLGPEVERLEADFAALCGVSHGVALASGTDALILALRALGVGPGDGVVTSPFTFFASAAAIAWIGARPLLADVDPDTGLLDPERAAAAIDARTRSILPVHLYGQMADMPAFRELADRRGLVLLEDAAQAHGAERAGTRCGQLGDAAAFSFYPTKNLGAAGEAGMVVVRDEALARRLRLLRDHGSGAKYEHDVLGTNARMHALQAAVLNVKLPRLAAWNERRRALAARYDAAFAGSERVRPLRRAPAALHVYHQYTVRLPGSAAREGVVAALAAAGVQSAVHYPRAVHLQAAARPWGYARGAFPAAERLAEEVLSLPVHPFLEDGEVDRVAALVQGALG